MDLKVSCHYDTKLFLLNINNRTFAILPKTNRNNVITVKEYLCKSYTISINKLIKELIYLHG